MPFDNIPKTYDPLTPQEQRQHFANLRARGMSNGFTGLFTSQIAKKILSDAQAAPAFSPNNGVLPQAVTYIFPEAVEALLAPMVGEQISPFGVEVAGAWADEILYVRTMMRSGSTVAYGDDANGGNTSASNGFVDRGVFRYQTIVSYGELEAARWSASGFNLASEKQQAAADLFSRTHNAIWFFGVENVGTNAKIYGYLTDPSLPAPIAPAATGTGSSVLWINKTPELILGDLGNLFTQLQTQMGGNAQIDSPKTLTISPIDYAVANSKINQFGLTVWQWFDKMYPNSRVLQAPEMLTPGGSTIIMCLDKVYNQRTSKCVYNVRMQGGPVIPGLSNWRQKYKAGTSGVVITYPLAFAQMVGAGAV